MRKIKTFEFFVLERKDNYEYQVRDIDGNIYYKRKRGAKYWKFISKEEFEKNINDENVIAWLPSLDLDIDLEKKKKKK